METDRVVVASGGSFFCRRPNRRERRDLWHREARRQRVPGQTRLPGGFAKAVRWRFTRLLFRFGIVAQQFRSVFEVHRVEMHRVEMRPSSAPDEAVPFEARHYFRWYVIVRERSTWSGHCSMPVRGSDCGELTFFAGPILAGRGLTTGRSDTCTRRCAYRTGSCW